MKYEIRKRRAPVSTDFSIHRFRYIMDITDIMATGTHIKKTETLNRSFFTLLKQNH